MEFLKIIQVFAQGKESCNSTLKFVNFISNSGLGYCILKVAGSLLEDFEKKINLVVWMVVFKLLHL